ncbi:MAG: Hint domain-containing protein [Cypionkella sp.]
MAPQPLRWVGKATLQAQWAPFAPVVITAGTLGNAGDLIVSQHHRMFLYQREPTCRAGHLGTSGAGQTSGGRRTGIFIREGGFADYFSHGV